MIAFPRLNNIQHVVFMQMQICPQDCHCCNHGHVGSSDVGHTMHMQMLLMD